MERRQDASSVSRTRWWRSPWTLMGGSALLGWAILNVGFRILYESVTPEVGLLVLSGFVLGTLNDGKRAGIALAGLVLGVAVAPLLFPAPAPPAHVAQYGSPAGPSWKGFALIQVFPTGGTLAGMIYRKVLIWAH